MISTALDHLTAPPSSKLLGWHLLDARPNEGWIRIGFDGKKEFCNPAGFIQGGILSAMLDDTMGPALAATLKAGEFAPTLNLNVSFHRPATVGTLVGNGRVVKRGKDICFLAAELYQREELVASATATAVVRQLPA